VISYLHYVTIILNMTVLCVYVQVSLVYFFINLPFCHYFYHHNCSVGMFRLLDGIVGDACRDGKHVIDGETRNY